MSYHRPADCAAALKLLKDPAARILAGGTDLYPATERQCLSGTIVDLGAIDALRGVTMDAGGFRIGACTTWSDIIATPLPPAFDALKDAAREVGSVQIQNAGTIGGNLCNASPAADGVPPLLAQNAEAELLGPAGARRLPLGAFLKGNRKTALADRELMTAVFVPESGTVGRSRFIKLGARRHLVISIAMVAVRLEMRGDTIDHAALSVGACSAVAQRLPHLEAALTGARPADALALAQAADLADALAPLSDIRADASYRLEAARALLVRALEQVLPEAVHP